MNFDLTDWVRDVLRTPTDRDKQKLIGPSGLGNLCTRCLADAFLNAKDDVNRYWLGSVVGTSIHELYSSRVQNDPNVMSEFKVDIGEIPGYGKIKGTVDLYVKSEKMIVDLKSTTRKKLAMYRRVLLDSDPSLSLASYRHTIHGYVNQTMTYGSGVVSMGLPVKRVGLALICRDGTGDSDIWTWTTAYDPNRAKQVWDRAVALWQWLQEGNDPNTLPSAEGCYYCTTTRGV